MIKNKKECSFKEKRKKVLRSSWYKDKNGKIRCKWILKEE